MNNNIPDGSKDDNVLMSCEENIESKEFVANDLSEVIDNGIDKEVLDEVCIDDIEVEGNQSKINSDCVVMGVNEFVGGANRSEGNLVLRSNSRFLADEYERNIFEVEDKRGIGDNACKFAISILNCIDQGGLISGEMYTLVFVWNLATGEKVDMPKGRKMQATCVTLDGSDVVSVSSVDCTIIRWKGDDLVYYFEGTSNASSQPNTLYVYLSYDYNCAIAPTKKKSTRVRNREILEVVWKPMVKMRMNGIIMSENYCMCGIRKEGKENMDYFVSKTTITSKDLSIKNIKSCWVVSDNHCKGSEVTDETKIKDDTLAGKDLETENNSSRARLGAMKTMLENVIGSVKRIRGDKEDCILESQDKKVDNDVKEIRKRSV
nr:phospholipase A2-activating protein [Tanacetum cinerariifolium]